MPQEFEELLEALRAGQRAFNEGDFETAFEDAAIRQFARGQDAGEGRLLRAAGLEE